MKRLAGAALLVLVSCTKPTPPPAMDAGAAGRVVSLSPSTTEALFAIGAGAQTVGRSRYCDYPPEAEKLPQVGGYVDPNLEAILALRPDLVTGARGPAGDAITRKLDARGVGTFFPETESFAAIDAMILGLGTRTGHDAEAKALTARIDAKVGAVQTALAKTPPKRVLLVFGLEPLSVAGPSSFPDAMIAKAGGKNVVVDGGAYPTIGVEHVIALDPDVVVNASMAESPGKDRIGKDSPGWSKVRAVNEGRVVRVTEETILRPGPRVAEGVVTLARAIHPEASLP